MLIVAAASISAYDSFEDDSLSLDADYLNDILNPSRISRAAGWKLRAGKRAALWKLRTGKRALDDYDKRGALWKLRTGKRSSPDYAIPDDVIKRDALWKLRTGKRADLWKLRTGKRSFTENEID
jgi:hypothetical protein